jgi:hypothetical protein
MTFIVAFAIGVAVGGVVAFVLFVAWAWDAMGREW